MLQGVRECGRGGVCDKCWRHVTGVEVGTCCRGWGNVAGGGACGRGLDLWQGWGNVDMWQGMGHVAGESCGRGGGCGSGLGIWQGLGNVDMLQRVGASGRGGYVKVCQMSQSQKMLTMNEVNKKFNLTQSGSHTRRSVLMSHMMVTENLQKLHKICFGAFLMIFIFHLKINLIVSECHCVKLNFLMNLIHSQSVWYF